MKLYTPTMKPNNRIWQRLHDYFLLTKPRVILLVMVTGLGAMILEGSLLALPLRFVMVLLGIILSAGAANAFNQFHDRDIDAMMPRTRHKRPLPAGRIAPRCALYFGIAAALAALLLLWAAGNTLAALLAFGAMLFYVVVYTLWLKRRTAWNIVIGGAAGAAVPLIGWAAGAGHLSMVPWLMFLVIFLWTPPHFLALALFCKEEYALAGIPMLPVVAGERTTCRHIAAYTAALLSASACLGIFAGMSWTFLVGTTLLGIHLVCKVIQLCRRKDYYAARALFHYSNIYLAGVFVLLLLSSSK